MVLRELRSLWTDMAPRLTAPITVVRITTLATSGEPTSPNTFGTFKYPAIVIAYTAMVSNGVSSMLLSTTEIIAK